MPVAPLVAPALLSSLLIGCGGATSEPAAPAPDAASPLDQPVSGPPTGFVLALSGNLDGEIEPCG